MNPIPIVACGFVNSGTRLLYQIIHDDFGLHCIHRSYPHWEELWDWRDFPAGTQWVIIDRRSDVCIPAAKAAKHPGVRKDERRDPPADTDEITGWYDQWTKMSAEIPAYRISYEELVADSPKVIGQLAEHLAYKGSYKDRQIRNENAKWLNPARS